MGKLGWWQGKRQGILCRILLGVQGPCVSPLCSRAGGQESGDVAGVLAERFGGDAVDFLMGVVPSP